MQNICVVGGGRWAKEIIKTILFQIKIKSKIFIITKNKEITNWAKKKKIYHKINFEKRILNLKSEKIKFIICNKVQNHYKSTVQALKNKCDILVEKPFFQNIEEAKKLIKYKNKIFYSKVFSFDHSLLKLSKKFKNKDIEGIFIKWHDPFIEKRFGLEKRHNPNIPYHFDVMPHLLNLAEVILSQKKLKLNKSKKIIQNNRDMSFFEIELNKIKFICDTSRKSQKRVRLIRIFSKKKIYEMNFSGNNQKVFSKSKSIKINFLKYKNSKTNLKNMLEAFLYNRKKKKKLNFEYGFNYLDIHRKIFN